MFTDTFSVAGLVLILTNSLSCPHLSKALRAVCLSLHRHRPFLQEANGQPSLALSPELQGPLEVQV